MDFSTYKTKFIKEAIHSGFSESELHRCLEYAEKLYSNNVPVIYNTTNLAGLVGYSKDYLHKAALFTPFFYRNFEILKKNGTKRTISEPLPSLKEIQYWILNAILYKVPVSDYAKAYKPKSGLMDNLKFHKNQPKVLSLDIENFFTSIRIGEVEKLFHQLGYSKLVSNLMAKLCCKDKSLPQGAPTSPCLSNLFFKPLDAILGEYCQMRKIRYTRYADDMTFSGDFDEKRLLKKVTETLRKYDLRINKSKTQLMTPDMRQLVTGIVVNKKPQVPFQKRNALRQTMYFITKYGLYEHRRYVGINQSNYLEHLIGQVQFVLQINPKDEEFQRYYLQLQKLFSEKRKYLNEFELFPI